MAQKKTKIGSNVIPLQLVGGLTHTSKMPCASYSLSALDCHTGRKLARVKGSVCSGCYATKGNYLYPSVKNAHGNRLASITRDDWADNMIGLIRAEGNTYFRWHDSGDLQSAEHLTKIATIARALPEVTFWLPTKEYSIVRAWVKTNDVPSNLVIRPSAPMIDGEAPQIITRSGKTLPVSYVHKNEAPKGFVCEAYTRGGKCEFCRACWDANVNVSYPKH